MNDNDLLVGSDATNKQKRFTAYKQFTYIIEGPLGKGNRKELPSCVVNKIRETWSDKEYTGFKASSSTA